MANISADDAEKELNSLFKDAVELRHSQDAHARRYFESLPACIQKTLFEETIPIAERNVEKARAFLSQGDVLFNRKKLIEALDAYEKGVGQVYFVHLRENAPHWRERGVRDEWIKVKRLDDKIALNGLVKVGTCLFTIKQYNEAFSVADFAVNMDSNCVSAHVLRAKSRLYAPLAKGSEEQALRDFAFVLKLDPENEESKQYILDIRKGIASKQKKEKEMFGGKLNKPGVRLVEESIKKEEEEEEEEKVRFELDDLEIEAAKDAGLDPSDPMIKEL